MVVRKGNAQGSGTIIASLDGETLVLTAAHVVFEEGESTKVELHRYNLGLERFSGVAGGWPRSLDATIVASDRAADLAVVRIGRMKRLPYVARLAPAAGEPARGTVVTSVGIDLGEHLSSWLAHVEGVEWFRLEKQKEDRPLLDHVPSSRARPVGGRALPAGGRAGRRLYRPGRGEAEARGGHLRLER